MRLFIYLIYTLFIVMLQLFRCIMIYCLLDILPLPPQYSRLFVQRSDEFKQNVFVLLSYLLFRLFI